VSPGRSVGARTCSTQAVKLAASIGPSNTPGGDQPLDPKAGEERRGVPTPIPPDQIRADATLIQKHQARRGKGRAWAHQAVRAAATSAGLCSAARTVLVDAITQYAHRATDGGQAGRGGEQVLQLRQRPIVLLLDQRLQLRGLPVQDRRPPAHLPAGRRIARLALPLLEPIHPRHADVVPLRQLGGRETSDGITQDAQPRVH